MNRGQQGQNPNQNPPGGYAQGGYSGPNQGGYAYYPSQNSGRQPASAGYFAQNSYPQGQSGAPQQGAAPMNNGYGFSQQGAYIQNTGARAPQQGGYYPQSQINSMPVQGGYPQSQGTGMPMQNGYPQSQGAGMPMQGGYPQSQGTGYPPQNGYFQNQGYPTGGGYQTSGSYPQMGQSGGYPPQQGGTVSGNSGQFIPQTPYQNGYNSQGYAYPPGYSAYQQMGRNTTGSGRQPITDSSRQMPLNGAGYVPQPVPVRKAPFQLTDTWLILISALLLILFAAGMFAPGLGAMKWIFLALAAASIAFLWIRPVTAGNKRLCYTIVFGALCLVTAVSMAAGGAGGTRNGGGQNTAAPQQTASPYSGNLSGGIVVDGQSGQTISSITVSAAEETPAPQDNDNAVDRLKSFFYYWNANLIDEMLTLCAPSWQSGLENPRTSLFALMANRKPKELTTENITGTNDDDARTVTITVVMDKNNGKDPVKYRMNVIMLKENDVWYVDPQSLKSNEKAQTENPDDITTPTPSPTPLADGATVLYYNPDGGTKYHLDPNCKSTHEKYLPMKGHFKYSEVNDPKYANLSPCNVCGAPLRLQ